MAITIERLRQKVRSAECGVGKGIIPRFREGGKPSKNHLSSVEHRR
jgi:hypothetical protein